MSEIAEQIHYCEICNERAIVGLNTKWYCPAHIDAGMKLLAKPVRKAIKSARQASASHDAKLAK